MRRGEQSERCERKERKKEKPVTGNVQCRNAGASIPMIIITIIHLHTHQVVSVDTVGNNTTTSMNGRVGIAACLPEVR